MKRSLAALLAAWFSVTCDTTDPPSELNDEPGLPAWSAVSSGPVASCALTADGTPYCWGDREPGDGQDGVPTAVPTSVRFTRLAVGSQRRCGVTGSGDAYCWGKASSLESLGDGVTDTSSIPIKLPFPAPVRDISAAHGHACALIEDGAAYCWGLGFGNLGDGIDSLFTRHIRTPTAVATTLKFTAISTGTTQTCAVAVNREAYCWGGGYGSLGIGGRDTSCAISVSCYEAYAPELVAGGFEWKSVSAGNGFTCGITIDDRGYCWGAIQNHGDPTPPSGKLGHGDFGGSYDPVPVYGDLRFRQIVTGQSHACGVTLDGEAYCWGDNELAALGIGSATFQYPGPMRVLGNLRFESLAAGLATCGVSVNHNLFCWGVTAFGLLGNGVTTPGWRGPTRVSQPAP